MGRWSESSRINIIVIGGREAQVGDDDLWWDQTAVFVRWNTVGGSGLSRHSSLYPSNRHILWGLAVEETTGMYNIYKGLLMFKRRLIK